MKYIYNTIIVLIVIGNITIENIYSEQNSFLHALNGETIIGMPANFTIEIDPDGKPMILTQEGRFYEFNPEISSIEKMEGMDIPTPSVISPDKKKILYCEPQESPRKFIVYDWYDRHVILEGVGDYEMVRFLNDGRFLLTKDRSEENALLTDLDTGKQSIFINDENIATILEVIPEQQIAIGVYAEKTNVTQVSGNKYNYTIDCTYYHCWNYVTNTVIEHIALENSRQFIEISSKSRTLSFLCLNRSKNQLIAIDEQMVYHGYGPSAFIVWDNNTGKQIPLQQNVDCSLCYNFETSIDKQWILIKDFSGKLVNISNIANQILSYAGPFFPIKETVFDDWKKLLYLYGKNNDIEQLSVYDALTNQYTHTYPLLNRPLLESEVIFLPTNDLITYPRSEFECRWNFPTQTVDTLFLPRDLANISVILCYAPNQSVVGVEGKNLKILNSSYDAILQTLTVSENDSRYFAAFNHSGSRLLAASGNDGAPGVDNLIRIWDAENYEMLTEIRGHTDSVWYAEFSPDDRRIVSASLDGTAKVWDANDGTMVSSFIDHATGVVYAAFFPDNRRILSAGNDRRAYIWDAETAQVEKTLENIHLPARLSPDGKYLFAGSEVWDIEAGAVIRALDGAAQDLSCLTLSPDGTLLLTSEFNGFTKVWNVQEHILKPAGIEKFSVFE